MWPSVARGAVTAAAMALILVLTLVLFRLPVVESLRLLEHGAFGDRFGWSRTAVKMIPMLFTGLGMVVAWRAGIFNIGGEGQFIVGALLGCAAGRPLIEAGWPPFLAIILILAASAAGGAAWAYVAGWLYIRRGVEVVISTILLNFVSLQLLGWAVSGPLQESKRQVPLTDLLPEHYMLPRFDPQTDLHAGLVLAFACAFLVWVFLSYTAAGFQVRVVGANARLARSNRIDPARVKVGALLLSGAICGLAGGVEYTGVTGQLGQDFPQQWGFLGIPVALLAGLHPLYAVVSAFIFGALFAGSENLARFTPAGTTLIYVVQAAALLGYLALQRLPAWRPRQTVEGD